MVAMTPEQFELCVSRALDEIPDEIAELVENVAVIVEDVPPPGEPPDLMGLYVGTPVTERWGYGGIGALPDRILIFREPTLAVCETVGDVVEEVAITVVHEVAHFFGLEEDRIHALGWG
jgi:predicted Zn-dependent protease with MMP-like domain